MDFIDEVTFSVQAGKGGDGCVSYRREKFVPKGGPDGGDGGDGGSVILRVSHNLSTLFDLKHKKHYRAGEGGRGRGKNMHGRNGKDCIISVPPGTLVYETGKPRPLCDLVSHGQEFCAVVGGRGGRGNTRFASPTRQAPDKAEKGSPGETKNVRLVLKLLADVGLVGFPNAGKSTLLSRISAAKPKIADYPFTTLVPHLGIVTYREFNSFVVADIPGLIEGAHRGRGLGDRFLRHVERTRAIVFLIEAVSEDFNAALKCLIHELEQYGLALRPEAALVAWTKTDLLDEKQKKRLPRTLSGMRCIPISSITGEGLQELLDAMFGLVREKA